MYVVEWPQSQANGLPPGVWQPAVRHLRSELAFAARMVGPKPTKIWSLHCSGQFPLAFVVDFHRRFAATATTYCIVAIKQQRIEHVIHYFISWMICFNSAGISGSGISESSIWPSAALRTTKLSLPKRSTLSG